MAEITLKHPEATGATLRAMREFTGAQDDGRLIQDALRVYAWVLCRQAQGLDVCAGRYCLDSFISEEHQAEAAEYFERLVPLWKADG